MRLRDDRLIFSPSDLNVFLQSPFASWNDRLHLVAPSSVTPGAASDDQSLVAARGIAHEAAYVARLRADGVDLYEPPATGDRFAATLAAMREGRAVIYQAALRHGDFEGYADFLERVEIPSPTFGAYSYEVSDTKLARTPKPYFLVQLCAYAEMLEHVQGRRPGRVHVVTGANQRLSFRTDDHFFFYRSLKSAFLEAQHAFDPKAQPVPEATADHGRWQSHADAWLEGVDHPSRVAGITAHQVKRLAEAGITTMRQLGTATVERIPRMDPAMFGRLRAQADLQLRSVGLPRPLHTILAPDDATGALGLALLPPASHLDVFFDMEGFPFAEGGLEYLFGATVVEHGKPAFHDFWAHDAAQEKKAFEDFVDWISARHRQDPTMHVYHYAAYEVSALRRLMGRYGTREEELDRLLRAEVFVDLYRIVRQGVRVGEPRYSLKNVEHLYRAARAGDVSNAGQSVVEYARWLEAPDGDSWKSSKILASIRDYNRDDCDSTWQLAEWLRTAQHDAGIAWAGRRGRAPDESEPLVELRDDEALAARLVERIPADRSADPERWRVHELLAFLVGFHRREAKPAWWAMFDRRDMTHDELTDDLECLGNLVRTKAPPTVDKRSLVYEYRFDPTQDTKMVEGNDYLVAEDLSQVNLVRFDADAGIAALKRGKNQPAPPQRLSLIPGGPIDAKKLAQSIRTVAESWESTGALPGALDTLLFRKPPRIEGCTPGEPLRRSGEGAIAGTVRIVRGMQNTTLAIQGPPGAGKTHTAAEAIVALLRDGFRVGVTSNSHKPVEKLMLQVLDSKSLGRTRVRATKVSPQPDEAIVVDERATHAAGMKHVVFSGKEAANLVGGTAWAFSDPSAVDQFDYLFVDEAGQVSMANLVAMSPAARNLVLLGDQMQLGQPTQGSHPGESGLSVLDYLMGGAATIPDSMGIFLETTWRMHPDLCRFISGAVYEDRLHAEPVTAKRLIRASAAGMKEAGLRFVPVAHEGNVQCSDEEVTAIVALVNELCGRRLQRDDGTTRAVTPDDILIVAPYNMQVLRLRAALPGVRVASVDKFQGQEAPIVIVSMCASSGEASPRGIEFLFSANRLNVAISRAQSLAIVVASERLARTRVGTVEQQRLVNLFCRIVEEGRA